MMQAIAKWLERYSHVNWALADQGMISASNFLASILMARYLGLDEFGRFTLVWLVVEFFSGLQHATIIAPMMSIAPKQAASERRVYFGAVMAQQACFVIVAALVLLIGSLAAAPLIPDWRLDQLAWPLCGAVFTFQIQNFLRRYFFTRSRGLAAFLCDAIRYPGQLLILIWLFHDGDMDSVDALWVIVATSGLASIFAVTQIERPGWNQATLLESVQRHWKFSKCVRYERSRPLAASF